MGRRMGGIKMEEYIEVSAKTKEEAIMNVRSVRTPRYSNP